MTLQSKWATRVVAVGAIALAAILPVGTTAGADPSTPDAAGIARLTDASYASTQVTVDYGCLVTFPGGSATMPYSLTFKVTAPSSVSPKGVFGIAFDPPVITPNPTFQSDVRDVELKFRLPSNASLVGYVLYGGSNLSGTTAVERKGDVLVLRATGPFTANVPFDLPTLAVGLVAGSNGVARSATGGTSVDNPSFSWVRNSVTPGDPPNTLRPLLCEPPAPVTLSSTTIG
ncbi:hypothetical protein ACFYOT_18270 [Saccharothrix saharensis]|uniref:hypothetical protein n=1 Tax=Saccharothrix saharensis TaxID=571190 RepID=UPI0036C8E388